MAFRFALFSIELLPSDDDETCRAVVRLHLVKRMGSGTHAEFMAELPAASCRLCFCALPAISALPCRLLWQPTGASDAERAALRSAAATDAWRSIGVLEVCASSMDEAGERAFVQARDKAEMDELED